MQEKSAVKLSRPATIPDRLKYLRVVKQCNWAEIAQKIELSEAMIFGVIAGKKRLSDKAEYRLAVLEQEAGIESESPSNPLVGLRPNFNDPDQPDANNLQDWKKRAIAAEKEVERMKAVLRELSTGSAIPAVKKQTRASSGMAHAIAALSRKASSGK